MKKLLLFAALAALLAVSAHAADLRDVVKLAAGVNGAWFDGPASAFPADVEIGGNAAASLSPHLSWVGAAYYGFDHSYARWSTGARVTVTDAENPNFSVGLGIQYHGASEVDVRPAEWAPDASFGWLPAPDKMPALAVVGQAGYGLNSNKTRAILGLRYRIRL